MANIPPVANAGPDQTVVAGNPVTLTGSGSTDADGTIVSHVWSQVSGLPVALSGSGVNRTFVPTTPGVYVFQLAVTDNGTEVVEPPPPDPDPDPPNPSWEAVVASRDFSQVTAWYQSYTGHDGINPEDPDDEPIALEDLSFMAGGLTTTSDGQVIEGYNANAITVRHNNVTIRRCRIRAGGNYGLNIPDDVNTGTLIQHCSFDGVVGGVYDDDDAAVYFHNGSQGRIVNSMRYCDIQGYSSGVLNHGGGAMEYCWTHNFSTDRSLGQHISSFEIRGQYIRLYRCYATEGISAPVPIYPDQRPMHYFEIRENIINHTPGVSNNDGSWLMQVKNDQYTNGVTNAYIGRNYFGNTGSSGTVTGLGLIRWGQDGNVLEPNYDFLTGNPVT